MCNLFYIFWCMHCFVLSPEKAGKKLLASLFLKSGNAEGSFNFIVNQGPKTQMPKGPE